MISDHTQCRITGILVMFRSDHGNYALFCWYYALILCLYYASRTRERRKLDSYDNVKLCTQFSCLHKKHHDSLSNVSSKIMLKRAPFWQTGKETLKCMVYHWHRLAPMCRWTAAQLWESFQKLKCSVIFYEDKEEEKDSDLDSGSESETEDHEEETDSESSDDGWRTKGQG